MQFFGKMSRFTHFFLGSAQTVKIIPSSAFKFLSALVWLEGLLTPALHSIRMCIAWKFFTLVVHSGLNTLRTIR